MARSNKVFLNAPPDILVKPNVVAEAAGNDDYSQACGKFSGFTQTNLPTG
jgi:hypothetical protein